MEFSSLIFIFAFLPAFFLTYFIFKKREARNIILLVFSIIFYAWGGEYFLFLVLLSIIINYYLAIFISKKKHSKLYLLIAIIFDLGVLAIFKYTDFLISTTNTLFSLNIPLTNIILPVGISFYTFQILSYVIDVYRNEVKVQKNILNLACYIMAFPQLIAGPIVRYKTIEDELTNRKETEELTDYGIKRFIQGLAKKVLIANNVGLIATTIFAQDASTYGFVGAWLGMISYTLQIYFDFSGYSDMAIGIGRILGFKFLENFDYPYISKSITEFWRRWHMSLSSFFRDYVYIPLGGNRVPKWRFLLNILIVWSLTGLWHGASWNFVAWGLYYGIILLIEKLFLNKYLKKTPSIINHLYTMLIVIIGWVFFRSINISEAITILKSMIGLYGIGNINLYAYSGLLTINSILAIIIGLLASTTIIKKVYIKLEKKYYYLATIILLGIFILSVLEIAIGTYNPFIYFRF